jgi:hypothetical protein
LGAIVVDRERRFGDARGKVFVRLGRFLDNARRAAILAVVHTTVKELLLIDQNQWQKFRIIEASKGNTSYSLCFVL